MTVALDGLDDWRKSHSTKDLILYLNGHPVAIDPLPGPSDNQLTFDLEWQADSEKHWGAVVGRPQFNARQVRIQVGARDQSPFSGTMDADLETLDHWLFSWFAALFIALLIGFWVIARKSDILRDGAIAPAVGRRPYSLGRTQMAVWFFVVVAAFLFIWIVTGNYQQLPVQVLALIGISAGTALGAAMIDSSKQTSLDNQSKSLDAERLRLETEVASLKTLIAQTNARITASLPAVDTSSLKDLAARSEADVAQKQERWNQVQQQLVGVGNTVMPRVSEGFLRDLLTDENGVGFHRFQIAVWTVVLVLIFGFVVYRTLGMPTFPTELLALMGLSSGTYLGFKLPESI